jgi:hypothetical protein
MLRATLCKRVSNALPTSGRREGASLIFLTWLNLEGHIQEQGERFPSDVPDDTHW